MKTVQNEAKNYQNTLIFSWSGTMNFEYLYPVLGNNEDIRKIKIYSFGRFIHASFSTAYNEEINYNGLIQQFKSQGGIFIVTSEIRLKLLNIWCKEWFNNTFIYETIYSGSFTKIYKVKCNKN